MAADYASLSPEEKKQVHKAKVRKILVVTAILAAVTAVEFLFAFVMGAGFARTSIFLILTVVKAYYIMYEFMHLGHEASPLKMAVIFPLAFVLWLLVAMIWESWYTTFNIPGRYYF